MHLLSWLLTPFGRPSTKETPEHAWDPQTVTVQQPLSPAPLQAPNANMTGTTHEATALNLRGGGEAGDVLWPALL
ncbi:hypothetical protein BO86DRAFT_394594 [Aspergillus japonicus CBS 114.51]|uniref:Uncharacterized protein n=2 Tax=Aspergillus TaxID=5052 RepID=A0A2V5H4N4_ASPV1|nr:hypothetical protein BO86DRAFT_394594 [Aspergillus japonicus CBS 114.51]PYI19059.1 hypothetical protein BO99DRAFT_433007 [Aspergillus violaceofuscus CBS 115571]RAH86799.1 hypothetical protein BO86DRAFT_394594 [Aspergillus japonicus CBS 114.51]